MINYWIFQANPEEYNIRERLRPGKPKITSWRVKQHADEIKEGDRAFVWTCKGNEPEAGLSGFLEVLCDPILIDDLSFEVPFYQDPSSIERTERVICRIVATKWITKEDILKQKPELARLPNLMMTRHTNYRLDEQQATLLRELMGVW